MAENVNNPAPLVGVEASLTSFTAVSIGPAGEVLESVEEPLDGGRQTIPQLVDFINSLRERLGGFERLGVAVPGLISRGNMRVAYSARIPEHSGRDLTTQLQDATGARILIENDANAAAFGEYKHGAGRGSANMFYVTLGAGVGGAFIFDGRIWHGSSGFAGEFGYVPISSDGMRLEEVASAANIVRRTRSRFHQDSTSSLNRLDENSIGISDIVGAAEREDDFARMMLQRTGEYVGTALASVINLLNIERIVIGGEIMRPGHIVLESVIARARELSFGPSFQNVEIVAAELDPRAAAIGAALLSGE
jgi:glucokinase